MEKLTRSERKKFASIYRAAAAHPLISGGCGCCHVLHETMLTGGVTDSTTFFKIHVLFRDMFEPDRHEGGLWWRRKGSGSVEARRFALLLAAEEAERGTITDYPLRTKKPRQLNSRP